MSFNFDIGFCDWVLLHNPENLTQNLNWLLKQESVQKTSNEWTSKNSAAKIFPLENERKFRLQANISPVADTENFI